MLCDSNGIPLRFLLSGGNASDITYAQPLLEGASVPSLRGRPVNAASGYWPTRGMMPMLCANTATATGCAR